MGVAMNKPKWECLTCGQQYPSQRTAEGHVVYFHLPDDWTADDLADTVRRVVVSDG